VELCGGSRKEHEIVFLAPEEAGDREADVAVLAGYGIDVRLVPRRALVKRASGSPGTCCATSSFARRTW